MSKKISSVTSPFIEVSTPIIWAYTIEENRFFELERNFLIKSKLRTSVFLHDATGELEEFDGRRVAEKVDPIKAIKWFIKAPPLDEKGNPILPVGDEEARGLLEDFAPFRSTLFLFDISAALQLGNGSKHSNPPLTRTLKKSWGELINQRKNIVIVSHTRDVPPELEHCTVLAEHELPTSQQLESLVKSNGQLFMQNEKDLEGILKLPERELIQVTSQLQGMTWREADNVLARAAKANNQKRASDPSVAKAFDVEVIREERVRSIRKNSALEIITPKGGLDLIAGQTHLKEYFRRRRQVFEPEWRGDGLSNPKGVLLCGPTGTGKTFLSACLAHEWSATILRGDVSACKGSLVGQTEGAFRRMLKDVENQAGDNTPVVFQLDEAGKMFGSGANGTSTTDSGVSGGISATYLTWRQNCTKPIYVVMTCNEDFINFPAAWLRAGRLDKVFFVDVPNAEGRKEAFNIHLKMRNWSSQDIDLDVLAKKSDGYTPAEIEQTVEEAILIKLQKVGPRPNPLTTEHLLEGIECINPMIKTSADDAAALRALATKRGYPGVHGDYSPAPKKKASAPRSSSESNGVRQIEPLIPEGVL